MEEPGSDKRSKRQFKSFSELLHSLEETGEDLERFIYPSLQFGAFFYIPNSDSGFGEDDDDNKHPWVIVAPYTSQRPIVLACPRTSSRSQARGVGELLMPGGILPELERHGVIVLRMQRPFPAKNFRYYAYIGLLPEVWQDKLRAALQQWAQKIARESEAP